MIYCWWVRNMQDKCYDIFSGLNLPFETYLAEYIHHQKAIHEEIEILWLLKGRATLVIEDEIFNLEPQTVFLVYMYREHAIESEPGSIIVSYRLKKEYLHRNNLFFEKINFKNRVYTFHELALKYKQVPLLVVQLIKLLVTEESSEFIRYKILGYYTMYIRGLYRVLLKEKYMDVKNVNYDHYLNRIHLIVEYTYQHFKEKITLDQLSKLTKISVYRLSHFIKDAFGISYNDFLKNIRFEHALRLLKRTKQSISEIVSQCGFSDQKYLNCMMKERFNMTTFQYRKRAIEHQPCTTITEASLAFMNELKACLKQLEQDTRLKHLFGMSTSKKS